MTQVAASAFATATAAPVSEGTSLVDNRPLNRPHRSAEHQLFNSNPSTGVLRILILRLAIAIFRINSKTEDMQNNLRQSNRTFLRSTLNSQLLIATISLQTSNNSSSSSLTTINTLPPHHTIIIKDSNLLPTVSSRHPTSRHPSLLVSITNNRITTITKSQTGCFISSLSTKAIAGTCTI